MPQDHRDEANAEETPQSTPNPGQQELNDDQLDAVAGGGTSGGGAGAGKVSISDLNVMKKTDASSPTILQ